MCEDEADAEEVEVTESDAGVMRLPQAFMLDVLLFLSFSNAFSCRFFLFQQPSSFFLQLSSSSLRLLSFFVFLFFFLPFFLF